MFTPTSGSHCAGNMSASPLLDAANLDLVVVPAPDFRSGGDVSFV